MECALNERASFAPKKGMDLRDGGGHGALSTRVKRRVILYTDFLSRDRDITAERIIRRVRARARAPEPRTPGKAPPDSIPVIESKRMREWEDEGRGEGITAKPIDRFHDVSSPPD